MGVDFNGKLNFGLGGVSTPGLPLPFGTVQTQLGFGSSLPAQNDQSNETSISTNAETGEIIIQNRSGATIVVSPNGDIVINATKALKFSTGSNISFEAGGNISFSGKNFSLNTAGAASFNIDGDMTTGVTGNKNDAVGNASSEFVNGNKTSETRGTVSQIAGNGITTTALGGMNNYVKGNMNTSVDGAGTIASSGTLKMTSEGSMFVSSPSINIGASNLSVFGASGFIGGSGVNIDGNRVTAEEMKATTINADGMKATTFEGDLKGIAEFSEASSSGGTFNSVGDVDDNPEITREAMTDDYLAGGAGGVIDVDIDPNDEIKNRINLGAKTGGALDHPPTIEQIQAMLRDKSNRDNVALTNWLVENGYLSPTYRNTTPKGVKSVSGNNSSAGSYTPDKNVNQDRYTPDPQYDPNNTTGPNQLNGPGARSSTLVGEGVPLATFLKLGAKIETLSEQEKLQFARYAHIHTKEFYNKYKGDSSLSGNKLEIVMGLYTPPSKTGSIDPGGINDLAQTGRVAVYEVIDASGKQNLDATYALAIKIANKEIFDKLVLDYDTYESKDTLSSPENPFFTKSKGVELEDGGIANVKIIVVLPEFGSDYVFTSGRAKNELETLLNGESQGKYLMNLQLGTGRLNHKLDAALLPALQQILIQVGDELNMRTQTTSGITGRRLTEGSGFTRDQAGSVSGRHNGFVPPAIVPWDPRKARQHTYGHASDTALYYPGNDGRRLNVGNSNDRALVESFRQRFKQVATERGFKPSTGVGPNYMSGNAFHFDVAAGLVIRPDGNMVIQADWSVG